MKQCFNNIISWCRIFKNRYSKQFKQGVILSLFGIMFICAGLAFNFADSRAELFGVYIYVWLYFAASLLLGYLVAKLELEQKKIPFIIKRPLPNGGSEYWKLSDLEDIIF
jgi:hypothetical protein